MNIRDDFRPTLADFLSAVTLLIALIALVLIVTLFE